MRIGISSCTYLRLVLYILLSRTAHTLSKTNIWLITFRSLAISACVA